MSVVRDSFWIDQDGVRADGWNLVTPQETGAERTVRMVDLFAGCGGLSLGFELATKGSLKFETVMALDNDKSVITCFNANHAGEHGLVSVGRQTDVTWFSHPGEVLLHFLVHCSLRRRGGGVLNDELVGMDVPTYLNQLRELDLEFAKQFSELMSSAAVGRAVATITDAACTLAIIRAYFRKLSIASIRKGTLDIAELPWREEYEATSGKFPTKRPETCAPESQISGSVSSVWDRELAKLVDAGTRIGKGQHSVVAERVRTVVNFMAGPSGQDIRALWVEWRARRDTLRATFTLSVYSSLRAMYEHGFQVDIVLGGPPCKGFSRIARPVMESLRTQGVSAWASHDYGDERNALMHQYSLFLQALRPAVFIFENVSNFTSTLRTPAGMLDASALLEEIIDGLSNHEVRYSVASQIVCASDHGVPQDRNRFIMVGFNAAMDDSAEIARSFFVLKSVDQPVPLQVALMGLESPHQFRLNGAAPSSTSAVYETSDPAMPTSWFDYLRWVQRPGPRGRIRRTDAHIYRALRDDDLALLKRFGPGQRWMDYSVRHSQTLRDLHDILGSVIEVSILHPEIGLPDSRELSRVFGVLDDKLAIRLLLEQIETKLPAGGRHHLLGDNYLGETKGHGDWFERLPPGRPCKTIISHIGKDTYSYFHPFENRAITIREAARVQSFPDSFRFGSAGVVEGYAMIGNAVPPLLANMFARRLQQLSSEKSVFGERANSPAGGAILVLPLDLGYSEASAG